MNTEKTTAFAIQVDDGLRRVPVLNTYGEQIGEFSFRPTDFGIVERYNALVGDLEHIVEPLEHISIAADGTADTEDNDDEAIAALREAEKRLFEACDTMFGGNMSEAFFGSMHPFSPVDGEFYCEKALAAVGAFISSQFETETKKVSARMSKYTSKYTKGRRK